MRLMRGFNWSPKCSFALKELIANKWFLPLFLFSGNTCDNAFFILIRISLPYLLQTETDLCTSPGLCESGQMVLRRG